MNLKKLTEIQSDLLYCVPHDTTTKWGRNCIQGLVQRENIPNDIGKAQLVAIITFQNIECDYGSQRSTKAHP